MNDHTGPRTHAGARRHRQDRPPSGGAPDRACSPTWPSRAAFGVSFCCPGAARKRPNDRHIGELYELTGPRLLTFAEAVAEISRAAGREIRYVPISIEDFAAAAAEQGVPIEVVETLTFIFGEVLDGRNARPAGGVPRALGREPRDFSDHARDAAATGIWNPTATRAA